MSITDRLDEIGVPAVLEELRTQHWSEPTPRWTLEIMESLVAALNEVIEVCYELEKEHQANPDHDYQQGLEEAAHRIRNVIENKLTREDQS